MAMRDEEEAPRSRLLRLEDRAMRVLWSFVERDASTPWFWIKVTVVMFLVTAGPMVAIWLFFLGRELGYFE